MKINERIHKAYKTKTMIRRAKRACQEMLDHYEGRKQVGSCPFCIFDHDYFSGFCETCPWVIIQQCKCSDKIPQEYLISAEVLRRNYILYPIWTNLRIRQLKRWIKHLDKALGEL